MLPVAALQSPCRVTVLQNNPAAPNIREMMLRREHSSLSAASGAYSHGHRSRTSSACGSPGARNASSRLDF